ncbi:hypothetical protein ABT364_08470 [Massilia sp. SR12]
MFSSAQTPNELFGLVVYSVIEFRKACIDVASQAHHVIVEQVD